MHSLAVEERWEEFPDAERTTLLLPGAAGFFGDKSLDTFPLAE